MHFLFLIEFFFKYCYVQEIPFSQIVSTDNGETTVQHHIKEKQINLNGNYLLLYEKEVNNFIPKCIKYMQAPVVVVVHLSVVICTAEKCIQGNWPFPDVRH